MARGGDSATSLAPGFRFHPTDEELIRFYLKRKVTNKPFRFDPISVIDIYKSEPWDLPGMSRLKSRDLEWYFFSVLDKKYSNGSKTNRATEKGYWKTTGKDRPIRGGSRTFGMKKTLVYHLGRAPRGERTNWVMHEYRLADEELERSGIDQDAFVLCRVFQKSGTGPKNGEQYGAPFIEEEWDDDDEVAFLPLPCEEMVVATDELAGTDDVYVEENDLEKKCVTEIAPENPSLPLNFYRGDSSNYVEHTGNFNEDDIKPMIGSVEARYCSDYPKDYVDLPGHHEIEANPVEDQYIADSSNNVNDASVNYLVNDASVNYLLEEPYLDASNNLPFDEGFFFEANDLSNPVEPESAADSTGFDMLDDYLYFFDADDDNMTLDLSDILESKFPDPEQEPLSLKDGNEGAEEVFMANQRLSDQQGDTDASSSKQKPEATKFEPDVKYPFLKQASYMLGGIPAPSALASEFPIKDGALRLNSAQASSSVHVTAGMIRIENLTLGGNSMDWSFGKNGTINIILSFGMSQGDNANTSSLVPMASVISRKTGSLVSRCWFLLMLFWVLILSVSYKIGSHICTK